MPSEKRLRQRENAAARASALRAAQKRRANRRKGIVGGAAAVVLIGLVALFVAQSTGGSSKKTPTGPGGVATTTSVAGAPPMAAPVKAGLSITTSPPPCPSSDGSSPRASHFASAPPTCIDPADHYTATFDTTQGTIVVSLDTPQTAGTVNNFVFLARYHYYDGSSLFRIDNSIDIIQGGAPTTQSAADPGPGYTIHDEPGAQFTTDSSGNLHGPYTYVPGDLVMARSSGRDSGAAQFFFVAGPKASALNSQGTYVVFGQVTSGLPVLQQIEQNLYEACPTTDATCGPGGAPKVPVIVKSVTITQA